MSYVVNTPGGISNVVVPTEAYEISVPFGIAIGGGIGVVTDPGQVSIQHILSIAFTDPGERVMRPTYGTGLTGLVFSDSPYSDFTRAASLLQQTFQQYDGIFATIEVTVQEQQPGQYVFSVTFILSNDSTVYQAVFDYAGNLIGTSSS